MMDHQSDQIVNELESAALEAPPGKHVDLMLRAARCIRDLNEELAGDDA